MGSAYYKYLPSKFDTLQARRARWRMIANCELKRAGARTREVRRMIPLRKTWALWHWTQFWRNRGWAVLSVLKVCHLKWRNRGIPQKTKRVSEGQLKITLNAPISFFTRHDIYEVIFKPASHYRGKSNWFAFIQHQEYSDGHISGSW